MNRITWCCQRTEAAALRKSPALLAPLLCIRPDLVQTSAAAFLPLSARTGHRGGSVEPYGATLRAPGAAPYAAEVFRTGAPVVSDVFTGSISAEPTFAVAVPVREDDKVCYAIVAGMSPGRIQALLLQQRLPPGWIAAVIDRQGVVVARTHEHERYVGHKARAELRERMALVAEEAAEGLTLDGTRVVTAFSRAPQSGWTVVIGVPYDSLTDDLRRTAVWLAAATLAMLGLGLALAWRLGARLVISVRSLRKSAVALGAQQVVENEFLAFSEIQQVGTALAQASRELRRANAELAGLIESAMDGIITIDDRQNIVLFNKASETIFGWSREQVLGQSIAILIPERLRGGHAAHIRSFAATGVTSRRMGAPLVVYGVRANGEEFPIDASISQLQTSGGTLSTVIIRDVTERMAAQAELATLAAEASMLREQEKKRIARELHDELAQSLAALKVDAVLMREMVPPGEELHQRIGQMIGVIDHGVAATRRIAEDLRPALLDDLGLSAALAFLVRGFEQRNGVKFTLQVKEDLDLQEPHATEVFRIVQESLANIAKHAKATKVHVTVAIEDGALGVHVQDDGVGFDTSAPRKTHSLGLAGLRERVQLLKGVIAFTSTPGEGTRIDVRAPFERVSTRT